MEKIRRRSARARTITSHVLHRATDFPAFRSRRFSRDLNVVRSDLQAMEHYIRLTKDDRTSLRYSANPFGFFRRLRDSRSERTNCHLYIFEHSSMVLYRQCRTPLVFGEVEQTRRSVSLRLHFQVQPVRHFSFPLVEFSTYAHLTLSAELVTHNAAARNRTPDGATLLVTAVSLPLRFPRCCNVYFCRDRS